MDSKNLRSSFVKLLEKLEDTLRNLVSLCKHSLSRLNQNVVLRVSHHFLCHVCISDAAFRSSDVLCLYTKVVDCVLQSVLNSTQVAADVRYIVDCRFDLVDFSRSCINR